MREPQIENIKDFRGPTIFELDDRRPGCIRSNIINTWTSGNVSFVGVS